MPSNLKMRTGSKPSRLSFTKKPQPANGESYDLLSFLSLFCRNTLEYSIAMILLELNVDRLLMRVEQPIGAGAISRVSLVKVKDIEERSEERRVGKECRSRWSPYH